MATQSAGLLSGVVLVGVLVGQVRAGGMVPTAGRSTSRYVAPAPTPAPVVSSWARPVTFALSMTVPAKTKENVEVDLRGPDGQVRRFVVEGGTAAIQYRNVMLRPGEALTIHWTPRQ
jgi:hypothetical protein